MLKSQQLCTFSGEIGSYCSASFLGSCLARREAYCCFPSAFDRIFQQQARVQLGGGFGDPKKPNCKGLTIEQISQLDFDKMNFDEWIDMLQISGHLPNSGASADTMWDKSIITKGDLAGTQNQNTQDRVNKETQGTDIDTIRQYLQNNL